MCSQKGLLDPLEMILQMAASLCVCFKLSLSPREEQQGLLTTESSF